MADCLGKCRMPLIGGRAIKALIPCGTITLLMTMKYGSVCSGIEAASVAWHHLGWEAQWFSEIEHFPSEVLKYRFPTVENLGDMTKLTTNETFKASTIDLLVGGTPCQSFSVAGLRGGLADPRGNLMLTFLSLADSKKPRWIVWENVVGVLSSNGGKDFGTFLGALGELGYGFAYRVLDAQHFGVAQRRRRVFVVGYLGDWRVAAAVLFERESLQRDIKPSRKKREEVTPNAEGGVGTTVFAGNQQSEVAATFQTTCDNYSRADGFNVIIDRVAQPIAIAENTIGRQPMNGGNGDGFTEDGPMYTLNATGVHGVAQPIPVLAGEHPQKGISIDVCPTLPAAMGMGGGHTPLVPHPVAQPFRKVRRAKSDSDFETWEKDETANTLNCFDVGDVRSTNVVAQPISIDHQCNASTNQFGTLIKGGEGGTQQFVAQPIAVDTFNQTINERTSQTIGSSASDVNHYGAIMQSMAIRRLTPKECERLQGFPDDWTKIPYRNKPADQCPDGPRYKACGNSMAVPVMRWIGERIQLIDTIIN